MTEKWRWRGRTIQGWVYPMVLRRCKEIFPLHRRRYCRAGICTCNILEILSLSVTPAPTPLCIYDPTTHSCIVFRKHRYVCTQPCRRRDLKEWGSELCKMPVSNSAPSNRATELQHKLLDLIYSHRHARLLTCLPLPPLTNPAPCPSLPSAPAPTSWSPQHV